MPKFLDLPEDILFIVLTRYIAIRDVLSLQQTCRVLHAFGQSDYLWRRLALSVSDQLLLDIAHKPFGSLPYKELQQSVIRAIRVDANWSKEKSTIRSLIRIFHGGIVYAMILLQSGQRLATLSRVESGATMLSLWDIGSIPESHILGSVEVPYAAKLAGTMQEDGSILVTVLSSSRSEESLSVFSFSAVNPSDVGTLFHPIPKRIFHLAQHPSKGVLGEVQVCGNVISVTVAVFATGFIPPTFRVLVVNGTTGLTLPIEPHMDAEILYVTCKLFPAHALLITASGEGLILLRLYKLPHSITGLRPTFRDFIPPPQCMDFVAESRYSLGRGYDFHFSDGLFLPNQSRARLSILAYPVFSPFSGGMASLHAFDIDLASVPPTIMVLSGASKDHHVRPGAFTSIVCLGGSGFRAVWMEKIAESDEMKLIKSQSQCGSMLPIFGKLVPPHITLPFAMQTCESASLDEAMGRVCLGLHTGELYFLDF